MHFKIKQKKQNKTENTTNSYFIGPVQVFVLPAASETTLRRLWLFLREDTSELGMRNMSSLVVFCFESPLFDVEMLYCTVLLWLALVGVLLLLLSLFVCGLFEFGCVVGFVAVVLLLLPMSKEVRELSSRI